MFMCTGMFLLKTAYGYGKRVFVRRSGDCVVYIYQFHVPCGSCNFLFPLLQAACEGDPKWYQFYVSCHVHCHLMTSRIYQLQSQS